MSLDKYLEKRAESIPVSKLSYKYLTPDDITREILYSIPDRSLFEEKYKEFLRKNSDSFGY